jgi:hypothetical protein
LRLWNFHDLAVALPCCLQAFVSQVSQQLPAFENEDYGLLLHGLAALGQPLSPGLLARFAAEAGRKLYGLSGEGLGLLVWGLAQYDYTMKDAEEWWVMMHNAETPGDAAECHVCRLVSRMCLHMCIDWGSAGAVHAWI